MKKVILGSFLLIIGLGAWAKDIPEMVLDKVVLQFSVKDWVSTDKALLYVNVNMTMSNTDMVQARNVIMNNLNLIAKGDWHITQFNRSQDSSGLERLSVTAEARVDQSLLTDVYQQAKTVTKPGSSYTVANIDFTPGLPERQILKNKLRLQLYQQVQTELQALNKAYPEQHYSVNRIVFVEGGQELQPKPYRSREMNTMVMAASAAPISVSNEILLTAVVELASNRLPQKGIKDD